MKLIYLLCISLFLAMPVHAQWQVVVFPYENQTNDTQWDWFSRGISESLITAYDRVPQIRVIDEIPLEKQLGENWPTLLGNATLADQIQIHIVLKGTFVIDQKNITITTHIIEADNGKIRRTVTGQASRENPFEALASILTALPEELKVPLEPDTQTALHQSLPIDLLAFQTTIDAVRAFYHADHQLSPDPALLTQAEQSFKRALTQNAQNALAHYYLGQIYEKRDQIPLAEQAYRDAIKTDFDMVRARYHLAMVLKAQGRSTDVLTELEQALRQSPIDPDIQNEMSGVFFNQYAQTFETVSTQLKELIQSNPNDPALYYELANAYDELYRFDDAAQYYHQAIERDSTMADAQFKLGLIYHRQGNHEDAVKHLYSAIAHHTQFTRVHFRLGDILYLLDRFQEAAEQYTQALQAEPNYQIPRYHLGLCQLALGQTDAAFATFKKYIELTTDDHRPYYELGEIYRQRKEINLAIQNYQKAIEISPTYVPPRYQLAYLYAKQKEYAQAIKTLQIVLRLQPDHPKAEEIKKDIQRWEK